MSSDFFNEYSASEYGAGGGGGGNVGEFIVAGDDEGNAIGSRAGPGDFTIYPAAGIPIVATNAGSGYGDAFKVLESVTTGLSSIAKGYLDFQKNVAGFKTAQSTITLQRDAALAGNDMARLNTAGALELAKIKTGGAVDVAKYQAATQNLLAQRQLSSAATPSLGQLFYPVVRNAEGGSSINPLFIIVVAGGFFLAYQYSMKR